MDQQIRERLDRAAELAARSLEQELRRWELALEQSPPERVAESLREPGAGLLILSEAQQWRTFPPRQLLYEVLPARKPFRTAEASSPALAEAESFELRQKDYPKAIAAYQKLLATSPAGLRALLLHRVARTHRKAGRAEQARRIYGELVLMPPAGIGSLPADLVAKSELCGMWEEQGAKERLAACALDLYRELVKGRWLLEKSRYLFYSRQAQEWLAAGPEAPRREWSGLEKRKLALAGAVEALLAQVRKPADEADARPALRRQVLLTEQGTHLAFLGHRGPPLRSSDPGKESAIRIPPSPIPWALVLTENYLKEQVWPRVAASGEAEGFEVSVLGPRGEALFGSRAAPPSARTAARSLEESGLPWRLEVRPREPSVLYAELARRQDFYRAMLALVVALLIFGTYLTTRTVRRELEIARLKSDFVSIVSHEFRSPLTSIRQLGEMLMRGRVPSEERRQQYYELITRESERLARLMEKVLDFSRVEEGRKQYRFEPLDAGAWLRGLARDFQSEVAAQGISLVASVPEGLPPLVADREALSSAVQNLLDNAVKYSPDSKTVWLEAKTADSRLVIRVRDRGIGIAEEDRKRIFEKFYRSRNEAARQVKGVGLGLSLVKQIVAAHGGSVELESRPGEGSTFSIHLRVGPA